LGPFVVESRFVDRSGRCFFCFFGPQKQSGQDEEARAPDTVACGGTTRGAWKIIGGRTTGQDSYCCCRWWLPSEKAQTRKTQQKKNKKGLCKEERAGCLKGLQRQANLHHTVRSVCSFDLKTYHRTQRGGTNKESLTLESAWMRQRGCWGSDGHRNTRITVYALTSELTGKTELLAK